MRKIHKFSDEEMLDEYIKLGAYIKMLCNVCMSMDSKISGDFNKTHEFSKRVTKIQKELDQLRSDLEDSMPYDETTRACEERGINPICIFYGSNDYSEPNLTQMQMIYDNFLKRFVEFKGKED